MPDEIFKPQLEEIPLNISDIECKSYLFYSSVGLIEFHGIYHANENESNNALWMRWHIAQLGDISLHYIRGLIIDLRNLEFSGGDKIASITEFYDEQLYEIAQIEPVIWCILVPEEQEKYEAYREVFKQDVLFTELQQAFDKFKPVLQMTLDESQKSKFPRDETNITCEAYIWPVPETNTYAGFMCFKGFYKRGSAGIEDAHFITWIQYLFLDLVGDKLDGGVVFDLRELDYVWGNDLSLFAGFPIQRFVLPDSARHQQAYLFAMNKSEISPMLDQAFEDVKNEIQKKHKTRNQ